MADEEEEDYVPAFEVPKRRVWPFLVGLLAVAAVVAFVMYRNATKPEPLRVLIAVDIDGYWWDGSKPAATLADELGDFLDDKGFEVVREGQPNVDEVLAKAKDPVAAARELKASYVILGTLDPKVEKLPIGDSFYEVWIETTLDVQHTGEDEPFFSTPIQTSNWARERRRALELLATLTSKVARAEVLPALMEHDGVKHILTGHDPVLIDQLKPARNFIKARKLQIDEKLTAYQQLADRRQGEERGGSITFHSDMRAEDQLVGVTDRGVLRVSAPVELYYDPTRGEILRRERLETVEWVKDGRVTDVIWRGYNVFTYPSLAPDGKTVVLVEDLHSYARGLVVIRDGKMKRIRVEQTRAISEPRVSPDGKRIALVDRADRDADREIAVVSIDDASEVFRLAPDDYHMLGGFKWLDEDNLVVVAQPPLPPEPEPDPEGEDEEADDDAPEPPEPEPLGVYRVPLKGAWELLIEEGFRRYIDPAVSPDGKWLAVSNYATSVVLRNLETKHSRVVDVGGRASSLSFSPDSKQLVFEIVGLEKTRSSEIMTLDVATAKTKRRTHNAWPDRYPVFSHDGASVFFEARNEDPAFSRVRTVARIASVSVKQ